MSSVIHIFEGKRWSGDATSALHSALLDGGIVLTEGGEKVEKRLRDSGVADVRQVRMSGLFGALNLSRIIRLIRPDAIIVHSPSLVKKTEQGISLAELPVRLQSAGEVSFSPVEIEKGDSLIWIGYITKNCGLRYLLEAMKDLPELRLRVVGEGEAKYVSPLLKMSKSPILYNRVEWVGERSDVYTQMNGCRAGVISSSDPENKMVYKEFKAAGLPIICGNSAPELIESIKRTL